MPIASIRRPATPKSTAPTKKVGKTEAKPDDLQTIAMPFYDGKGKSIKFMPFSPDTEEGRIEGNTSFSDGSIPVSSIYVSRSWLEARGFDPDLHGIQITVQIVK